MPKSYLTGLNGNEIYCLSSKGFTPGDLVVGNSVFSMGFIGSLSAMGSDFIGGEVTEVTEVIREGRNQALSRMMHEAQQCGAVGVTGVASELTTFNGQSEFLSVANALHSVNAVGEHERAKAAFSTSSDGQQLYCQLDAGFTPLRFVFGNVAYSMGVGGALVGALKSLARGEIKEFSDVFNRTRHLAVERICQEAFAAGGSSVVGIETRTMPWGGSHEMIMFGTASHHPLLEKPRAADQVVTSNLTNQELWSLVNLGYMPVRLVLGTAVYSLGVAGGITSMFKALSRGEIPELTSLVYEARSHALDLIRKEAASVQADNIVGIRTHIQNHDGVLEFTAIGTAVRKVAGLTTGSQNLPPQAFGRDQDTWINTPTDRLDR